MSFSPWAILAIALVGVIILALLVMHRWRTRADLRKAATAAAAKEKTADPEAALGHDDGGESNRASAPYCPTPTPPSPLPPAADDVGESGDGPGGLTRTTTQTTTTATNVAAPPSPTAQAQREPTLPNVRPSSGVSSSSRSGANDDKGSHSGSTVVVTEETQQQQQQQQHDHRGA